MLHRLILAEVQGLAGIKGLKGHLVNELAAGWASSGACSMEPGQCEP